jgi:serine/threonine protein kinase
MMWAEMERDVSMERRVDLPEVVVRQMGRQILLGLVAAIEKGVVHRDLKPDNVLLATPLSEAMLAGDTLIPRGTLKVADWGLAYCGKDATSAEPYEGLRGLGSGTPGFICPEIVGIMVSGIFKKVVVHHKCDVFAAGVSLLELATGSIINELNFYKYGKDMAKFNKEFNMAATQQAIDTQVEAITGFSSEGKGALKSMLNTNPTQRPTAATLVKEDAYFGERSDGF